MKQNVVIVLWSISVLAALFIGQALNDPVSLTQNLEDEIYKPTPQKLVERPIETNPQVSVDVKKPNSNKRPSSKFVKASVTVNGVIEDLINHFEKPNHYNFDNYRLMADTWDKIKDLDEDQLLEVYSQLDSESEKGVNWSIARILYARMGELNPSKAINHAVENKQNYAINSVMTSWAKKSPLDALAWIQNNKDSFPKANNIDYYGLFNNVAKTDMNKALESLENFDIAKQRNAFNGILKSAETSESYLNILSKVGNFTDTSNKINSTLYYWAQKSPVDALAWAGSMEEGNDKKNAFRKIESAWLKKNPQEAADWILSKKEDKKSAVSTIVNGWDWKDGDNLYKWVQGQGDNESRDNANYNLIRRFSYNNVDLAKKAVDNIGSEDLRKKAVTQLYRSLRYKNQKAAEDFLKGRDEIPENEKEKLLSMHLRR